MLRKLAAPLVSVVATAAMVLLRWLLDPWLGSDLPFVTIFAAVAAAAYFGGWRWGLLTTLFGFAICNYLFIEPRGTVHLATIHDGIGFSLFMLTCSIMTVLGEAARASRLSAEVEHERLRITLASIGDGVIIADAAARVRSLNDEAERITGWTSAEAAGRPLAEIFRIVNEDSGQPVDSPADEAIRTGNVVALANHTVLQSRDGRSIPIDDSAAPIREPDGPLLGVVLVFRDVTEQRAAQRTRGHLAAIAQFSGDAIVTKNLDGIVQSWNASAERLFGYGADEIVGKPITLLIPPDRMHEEVEILRRLREGRRSERFETLRVAKDGRQIPVAVSVSPIVDDEGRVIGASKIIHDIGEMVAAREALARERELLETTLASIGDGVITTDAQACVTYLNGVAEQLTGWSLADATGQPLEDVFRIVGEDNRRRVDSPVLRSLREGTVVGLLNHTLLLRRDGTELPIDDSAAPIRDRSGAIVGCVLIFRDVTERRRSERELAESRANLQEADRRKDEFLATLAHELRNPLAPMGNSLHIIRLAGGDTELVERAVDTMERQVEQMVRLVDDLLDVARISRGKIELRREGVDLALVVQQAVESCRPLADRRRHELRISLPGEPVQLQADRVRLAQVLSNLINNACKYTEPGGRIELSAAQEAGELVLSVKDNGIGIPPEMLPHVFDMFTQVDEALERAQGGLGIGLTLARQLVEMHGGRIDAFSDGPGQGTKVVVRLPLPARQPAEVPDAASRPVPEAVPGRRILVVDDNKDAADSLAMLLEIRGHDMRVTHDGPEAIDLAKEFMPEVILLDIGLPRMSGLEVCSRIREQPWGKAMIIVALTGWGQEEDRAKSREAGFDHHLVKPVSFAALTAMLASLGGAQSPEA